MLGMKVASVWTILHQWRKAGFRVKPAQKKTGRPSKLSDTQKDYFCDYETLTRQSTMSLESHVKEFAVFWPCIKISRRTLAKLY